LPVRRNLRGAIDTAVNFSDQRFVSLSITSLTIAILATWRLTHLLWAEDGPWGVFAHLRRMAGDGFWGRLLDCFYCLSLWTAAPIAWWMGADWLERVPLWLALSGGAILLERLTTGTRPPPAARWRVDPTPAESASTHGGQPDVMLR
jgi:hypothetical protein